MSYKVNSLIYTGYGNITVYYIKSRNLNGSIKESYIRKAARKSKTVSDMCRYAGYIRGYLGSNSYLKIKRILGKRCFNEICSHKRFVKPKNKWFMPKKAKKS